MCTLASSTLVKVGEDFQPGTRTPLFITMLLAWLVIALGSALAQETGEQPAPAAIVEAEKRPLESVDAVTQDAAALNEAEERPVESIGAVTQDATTIHNDTIPNSAELAPSTEMGEGVADSRLEPAGVGASHGKLSSAPVDAEQELYTKLRSAPTTKVDEAENSEEDDDPQCGAWAEAGECIRNPQFMFAECSEECNSQVYVDAEDDCHGWADAGECEKNPGFMFQRCNASCISFARRSLDSPADDSRPNPHLDVREHRAATFLPIFLGVLALLVAYALVVTYFSSALQARQEWLDEAVAREKVRLCLASLRDMAPPPRAECSPAPRLTYEAAANPARID